MYRYFHGTSYESAINIMAKGFYAEYDKQSWNCSDDTKVYMYDMKKLIGNLDYKDMDEDDVGDVVSDCIEGAVSNARIAAAFQGSQSNKVCVFEIYSENPVDGIEEDNSCENMYTAVQISEDLLNSYIDNGTVNVKMHELVYYPELRIFYLYGLGDMFNKDMLPDSVYLALDTLPDNLELYALDEMLYDSEILDTYDFLKTSKVAV